MWRVTKTEVDAKLAQKISIHTLRVEGDLCAELEHILRYGFQSTPSVWRVTAKTDIIYDIFYFEVVTSYKIIFKNSCTYKYQL